MTRTRDKMLRARYRRRYEDASFKLRHYRPRVVLSIGQEDIALTERTTATFTLAWDRKAGGSAT